MSSGPDWAGYFGGLSAFAGTLFALVLAARQIRRPVDQDPHPGVSRAYLIDSIAVTVELGAAASLALLYEIEKSALFAWAAGLVALCGIALSLGSAAGYVNAGRQGLFQGKERYGAAFQGVGNLFPLTCYVVALLYALRVFSFDGGGAAGYAAAVSWLVFSGVIQSIWWYARIWERESQSRSTSAGAVPTRDES
jgi:hypothetical protein